MRAISLIGAAAFFTLATAAPSLADDGGRGCSNASLKGRYGLATHGERFGVYDPSGTIHFYTGPSGDLAPVRVDQVSEETFDGYGNTTQIASVFANGSSTTEGAFTMPPVAGTYTVNPGLHRYRSVPEFHGACFCSIKRGKNDSYPGDLPPSNASCSSLGRG
jgi:hypothetical protein